MKRMLLTGLSMVLFTGIMTVSVCATDTSAAQQMQENDMQDSNLDSDSEKYYMPGEDLVLFELDGLQIILKGDQSDVDFAEGDLLAVEVVNGWNVGADICFGIDFEKNINKLPVELSNGDLSYAAMTLCKVPAASTAEGMIFGGWEAGEEMSLEDLQGAKIYFNIFDMDRFEKPIELGPVTLHVPEKAGDSSEEESTESMSETEETPAVPESLENLFGGIPDTVEEMTEGVKEFGDVEQLPLLYEQYNPQQIYADLREKGSSIIGVTGEDWFGNTSYTDEDEIYQVEDLTFQSLDDQSTEIVCEESFTDEKNTDTSIYFGYWTDGNGKVDVRGSEQFNIVSFESPEIEVAEGYASCRISYVTNTDTDYAPHYNVSLILMNDSDEQKTWSGVYDENGKLDHIGYYSYQE